jgi:hypothetical protein
MKKMKNMLYMHLMRTIVLACEIRIRFSWVWRKSIFIGNSIFRTPRSNSDWPLMNRTGRCRVQIAKRMPLPTTTFFSSVITGNTITHPSARHLILRCIYMNDWIQTIQLQGTPCIRSDTMYSQFQMKKYDRRQISDTSIMKVVYRYMFEMVQWISWKN